MFQNPLTEPRQLVGILGRVLVDFDAEALVGDAVQHGLRAAVERDLGES